MALQMLLRISTPLCPSFSTNSSSSSRLSSSTLAIVATTPISTLHFKSLDMYLEPFAIGKRGAMIVKAAAFNIEEPNLGVGDGEYVSDDEEYLLFDKVPLDSKLQQKLEQKMRMKLGKRIRIRRKKLIHKRRLRKKGQWPSSKMNKLRNV